MSVVIVHPEWGIYLGGFLGLGFFSEMDCAGQEEACVFPDEDEARNYVESWEENGDPGGYRYVEIATTKEWATIEELAAVGLNVEPLRRERLANLNVAGSA